MPKILVTGGAGFIGSHIVDLLISQGHEVHVVDDLSSGNKNNLHKDAVFHLGDIKHYNIKDILNSINPDVIVHTAAQISVRISMEDPMFDTQTNVAGLVNILENYREGKSPFFVFISTGGAIYGEQEEFPAKEDHKISPESIYGLAKRVSEMYLDLWTRQFGLKFAALRLSNVYGPRQNPHGEAGVIAIFAKKLIAGESPVINGDGTQTRDFVFVKDVASAVNNVIASRSEGIYNIGTGREASVNDIFLSLKKALKSDINSQYAEAKKGEQMRSCIDTTKANKKFGFKANVSLEDGLKETAEWFSKEK